MPPSAALPRVEDVAQGVAEQVGAEHHEADGDAGEDHQPGRRAHVLGRRLRQHAAPGGMRLGHAEAEERQRRLRPGWPSRAARWPARSAAPACWAARGATAMRVSLMPTARAASTNGISRSDSVLERMMRATLGTSGMAMAMMVLASDGPSEAAITSAITSSGSDCMMSIRRCTSRSNQPPKIARHQADGRRR